MNEAAIHLKLSVILLHTWSWTWCSALARGHREKPSIVVLLCLKAEEFYICMKCCYVHSASAHTPPVCTPYRSRSRHRVQQDVVFCTRRQSFYCDWQESVLSQGLLGNCMLSPKPSLKYWLTSISQISITMKRMQTFVQVVEHFLSFAWKITCW